MDGLETRRSRVNERLVALYRIKGTGYWHLFSRPGSVFDFWKRQQALTRIIRCDVRLFEEQAAALKALENTGFLIAGETGEKKLLEAHLVLEIETLETEQKKRRELLDGIREKTALTLAAMAAARKALEQTLEKLQPTLDTTVSARKKVGKTAHIPPGKDDFLSSKGGLAMPVKGSVISKFGSRTGTDDNTFTFQTGIDIKAERGEPVRCVFRGEVLYADWLKGYGNLIIINHGDNYYTLYAHVEELFKKKGDVVEDHEVIATAGDTGSIRGPSLHFEVRHHGKPVDPLKWLKKGV
jgi:septal ring factor EnvC (AmiA/AmiB activator)